MARLINMECSIIKSNRKTISLQIDKNANLIVRAPKSLSEEKILSFVKSKSEWIEKKQKLTKTIIEEKNKFTESEMLLYLGIKYPIKIIPNKNNLFFNGICFELGENCNQPDKIFKNWYKYQFKKNIIPRLHYFAKQNNIEFQNIRIKAQKTIWGSCSKKNNINLNYLLIMAPIDTIDYVIVHELSHIIHKNHSKEFWRLVESILPNYKKAKKWLKENGCKILLFADY